MGLLNDNDARFFMACAVSALEHLYERQIVHRDLKPENFMVDENGYLKLIDFGTAKICEKRTYTILGTPHYMAPEVLLGKGYNFTADLWSLGIIMYELLAGGVPFAEDLDDPYEVYQSILTGKLVFP
jgi:cGMP-dependent protein kinase